MAKDYKLGKLQSTCKACQKEIIEGDKLIAVAKFIDNELVREEYHPGCLVEPLKPDDSENNDILGIWQTVLPKEDDKKNKKLLVDDDLLINFFKRLEGHEQEDRINFRFVLALILMRKRVLDYKSTIEQDGHEIWQMKFNKEDEIHEVIDPGMDDERIASVSESLGEVMEGDFEN